MIRIKQFLAQLGVFSIILSFALGVHYLAAWTGAPANPPDSNIDAPINVGATDQVKNGGLSVEALSVYGSQYIENKLGIGVAKTVPVYSLDIGGTTKRDGVRFADGTIQNTACPVYDKSRSYTRLQIACKNPSGTSEILYLRSVTSSGTMNYQTLESNGPCEIHFNSVGTQTSSTAKCGSGNSCHSKSLTEIISDTNNQKLCAVDNFAITPFES